MRLAQVCPPDVQLDVPHPVVLTAPKFDAEQAGAVRRAHYNGDTVAALARVHRVSRPTTCRVTYQHYGYHRKELPRGECP